MFTYKQTKIKVMKKLFLITTVITILFAACKRDKDVQPAPQPTVPLQDLTTFSYFKTGTYWIYQDSATSVLDSVYVPHDTSYSYYQNNNIQAAGNYMFYYTLTYSYLESNYCYYRISMGTYSISDGHGVGVERSNNAGTTYLMSNEFVNGNVIYHYLSYGETSYQGYYDSITINGIMFPNVAHFHDTKNASETIYTTSHGYIHPATDFYIAKNIGIVKKKIVDTQFNTVNKTFYLIRYHIIQ